MPAIRGHGPLLQSAIYMPFWRVHNNKDGGP